MNIRVWLRVWIRSLPARLSRGRLQTGELEEELRSHIALRADDLEREGLSRREAERRARIEFGGFDRFREESREALGRTAVEDFLRDLRYAVRTLRKSPGFVVAAVLALALGVGANAVVFSVLNAMLLRPLNVPDANSLWALQRGKYTYIVQSYPDYLDLRDRNHSFTSLAAYNINQVALDTGGQPTSKWMYTVSGNYFDTLMVHPYLGRFFHAAGEHGANSAPYMVLSYAFWHSHFHGDRNVIGRVVQVNRHPFTIVGVAPRRFKGTLLFFTPSFFVPLVDQPELDGWNGLHQRGNRWIFQVLGNLKPGVTPAQATADLDSIARWEHKTYPKQDDQTSYSLVEPALAGNFLGRPLRAFLGGLMLLAGLVLLAACANLGSLFAARTADRQREIALRLALGSSRWRLLRQLFSEALLLSLAGGAVGMAVSVVLLRALSNWQPMALYPIRAPVNPDGHVYLVALLLTLASGFLFGAVPVRAALRTSPWEVVKAGNGGSALTRSRFHMREVLLGLQIALCAVLVTSSLVAVRGLVRSLHSEFGFDPQDVTLVNTDLHMSGYTKQTAAVMQKRMVDAVRAIPGVSAAAIVGPFQPLAQGGDTPDVYRASATDLRPEKAVDSAFLYGVTPGYFRAAGTALLAGRPFTGADNATSPRVAIINPRLARELYETVHGVVGRYFKLQDGVPVKVVGVAEQGKYFNVAESRQPALFVPLPQSPTTQTWVVVRSQRPEAEIARALETSLHGLDPSLPLYIRTWKQQMAGALLASRMATLSLGVMGLMGALLSITGIFGMAACSVSRRLKELGIRMALGARRMEVLRAALLPAVKLLAAGSAAGLVLGLLASKVLAHIVYEATPRDPLVIAGAVFTMALLGLVATWIPAQRALGVDPLVLLRDE